MWLLVMFDLPTETRKHRRNYRQFRAKLLADGFNMLQWSVYARPCATFENAEMHAARVADWVPDEGQVRVAMFTAMQFARMKLFFGKFAGTPEKEPEQLSFW